MLSFTCGLKLNIGKGGEHLLGRSVWDYFNFRDHSQAARPWTTSYM